MSASSFAVCLVRADNRWLASRFGLAAPEKFVQAAAAHVAGLRSEGPALALAAIEDDFFVIIRPQPGGAKLYISDALAATYDDYAQAVLDAMDAEVPEVDNIDDADPWPDGDDDILTDLGLSDQVLDVIAGDADAWASEQFDQILEELGVDASLDAIR